MRNWLIILLMLASLVDARKYDHIQTAALTYSSTIFDNVEFLANNIDLAINPANDIYDSMYIVNTDFTALDYATFSSIIMSGAQDTSILNQFCRDNSYDTADFYMWADEGTITITNGEARTALPGEIVEVYAAGHTRRVLDVRNPYLGDWIWYHIQQEIAEHGARNYAGVMEDEAFLLKHCIFGQIGGSIVWPIKTNMWTTGTPSDANGWDAQTSTHQDSLIIIQDSLIKLKLDVYDWPSKLYDSLEANNLLFFRNPANYMCFDGYPASTYDPTDYEDEGFKGLGYLLGEYVFMNPTSEGGAGTEADELAYLNMITTYAESNIRNIFWVYVTPNDTVALGGNSLRRAQYERLCLYYMGADPDLTWFMITDNRGPPHRANAWEHIDDQLIRYTPACTTNIGSPIADSGYYAQQSGTDGEGQSYTVRGRDFTSAKVLWRGQNGSDYTVSTAVTVNLSEYYYPVDSAGVPASGADSVNSVALRNIDGLILLKTSEEEAVTPASSKVLGSAINGAIIP